MHLCDSVASPWTEKVNPDGVYGIFIYIHIARSTKERTPPKSGNDCIHNLQKQNKQKRVQSKVY
jgi:hypothetical protein